MSGGGGYTPHGAGNHSGLHQAGPWICFNPWATQQTGWRAPGILGPVPQARMAFAGPSLSPPSNVHMGQPNWN
ncbi:hypothetical protein E2562_033482 [Oryza meyeriana var. granulata]|uniref:Uncharacterized protein n=1 Tax=Oryza meyeriana var. granulata TaxID=110450 RepID=A0A6G1F109_9ORYZ|nr:hypothetical protein E2562_033482 [Oryza meyeriana var. granulata]